VFFALVNSQTYQLLVEQLGWTVSEWRDWLVQVLDESSSTRRLSHPDRTARAL